jgi:hypothetical protein
VDRSKEKCHNCGKTSHWDRSCRSKAKREQVHVAQDDESSLLLAEAVEIVQEAAPSVELVPVAVEPEVVLMGLLASLPGSVAAVAPGG